MATQVLRLESSGKIIQGPMRQFHDVLPTKNRVSTNAMQCIGEAGAFESRAPCKSIAQLIESRQKPWSSHLHNCNWSGAVTATGEFHGKLARIAALR